MESEKLIRVDDLLEKARGTDAYFTVTSIVADLPEIDIILLATELKKARDLIPALREDNIRLRRELTRIYNLTMQNGLQMKGNY